MSRTICVLLILVAALGVFADRAAAQIPEADGTFYACVRLDRDRDEGRQLRLVTASEPCRRNEARVHWNQKGKDGLDGANGINGTNGLSVTFVDYFSGSAYGCPNGGAIYAIGSMESYVCNGTDGRDATEDAEPGAVGTWFGIGRPCPAEGADAGHAAFCQAICALCASTPGTLPPEMPMMMTVHGDGTVTVSDTGSIPVFHTTAQGAWAADPDPAQPQFDGTTRYQASFVWLQGDGGSPSRFIGVMRARFVMYLDLANPDNTIGYIQPHFFPIVSANGLVNVLPSGMKGSLDVTNHYPAFDALAQLPQGCTPFQNGGNCFGTFHFTLHRVKANVPN